MSTSTLPHDADEIRRQMALIRHELHADVREVVASAEAVTDWRRYLTWFPLVSLGTAFAVGYFLVPRRKPTIAVPSEPPRSPEPTTRIDTAPPTPQAEPTKQSTASSGFSPTRMVLGATFNFAVPLAVRFAQGYALKAVEQWLIHQEATRSDPREPRSTQARESSSAPPWSDAGKRAQGKPQPRYPDTF
ncbi:MAG: hypothetical protein U0794_13615 [Isosphaeraceae bacterium]